MVHSLTGGGAERVAASWANGLSALGHDVTILADLNGQTYQTNSQIHLIQYRQSSIKSDSILSKLVRKIHKFYLNSSLIYQLIKDHKPNAVVSVLHIFGYPLLLSRLLSGQKFPIIMTDHNAYERPKGVNMKWWQWKNKFIDNRFFDLVTVLTRRDKEILTQKGIRNVEVLHNPLFLEPLKTVPCKQKIVLACGRLDAWHCKGFDILIKAWKEIAYKRPDWKLRIVGHGSDQTKEFLYNIAGPYITNFEIVSYTSAIQEEYQNASIFVLSSRYEGWGLVMVEAMSQGCATIACDYNGRQAEVITDGENGLLCKPDDVEELKHKILNLIEDIDLRHRLQEKAIPSIKRFAEPIVASKLEALILKHIY